MIAEDDAGITSGAWYFPGISFTQNEHVYITGHYPCVGGNCGPVLSPQNLAAIDLFVHLGDVNGPDIGTRYDMFVDPGMPSLQCVYDVGGDQQIYFTCYALPYSGWGQVFDYVWLTVENQTPLVMEVYITNFSVEWSWSPPPATVTITPTPAQTYTAVAPITPTATPAP